MKHRSLVSVALLINPSPLLAWIQTPPMLPAGRSAGGSSSVFLLRNTGRPNRDDVEEWASTLQESTFSFHIYDNILEDHWFNAESLDRLDELDIVSSSSSTTLNDSVDDLNVCYGDECEV